VRIVVDACVGIKWFVHEELIDEADRLHSVWHRLIVPHLFLLEISNIALKKALDGEIEETSAHRLIPWLRQGGLAAEDTDRDRLIEAAR